MFSNDSDMRAVNGKNRDVENMFASASDYRIFSNEFIFSGVFTVILEIF